MRRSGVRSPLAPLVTGSANVGDRRIGREARARERDPVGTVLQGTIRLTSPPLAVPRIPTDSPGYTASASAVSATPLCCTTQPFHTFLNDVHHDAILPPPRRPPRLRGSLRGDGLGDDILSGGPGDGDIHETQAMKKAAEEVVVQVKDAAEETTKEAKSAENKAEETVAAAEKTMEKAEKKAVEAAK